MSKRSIALGIAVAVSIGSSLCASQTYATVTSVGAKSEDSQNGFVPSAIDIGNFDKPALQSRSETGYASFTSGSATSTPNALNDGLIGLTTGNTDPDLGSIAFDLDGVWTTTYTFNTVLFPTGFDISSIVSISAWPGGRTNQRYQVQYTTVNNPAPTTLGTFTYSPNLTGTASTQLTISDDAGPGVTIAGLTGVKSLIFNIMKSTEGSNPETVYREIDIFGQATVAPEPSTVALSFVAMLAAAGRFSRSRRKSVR